MALFTLSRALVIDDTWPGGKSTVRYACNTWHDTAHAVVGWIPTASRRNDIDSANLGRGVAALPTRPLIWGEADLGLVGITVWCCISVCHEPGGKMKLSFLEVLLGCKIGKVTAWIVCATAVRIWAVINRLFHSHR